MKSRGQCIHHMDPYRLGNAGEWRSVLSSKPLLHCCCRAPFFAQSPP
jgi:hypothetical protein